MSECGNHSAAVPWRSPDVIAVLASVPAVPLVVLLLAPKLAGSEAVTTVGIVLAEAIALYVGYGALARVASPTVRELIAYTR